MTRTARPRGAVRRRIAAALAAAVLGGLVAAPPAAAAYERTSTYIASTDGTKLHAAVFRDEDARGKQPVVLLVSPYNGQSLTPRYKDEFEALIKKGYAIVQVSLRGFGLSEGCSDFGGAGEQADVKTAVEWAARQPWSTGRVGMWGVSYDAWTQVMALATKPRGLAAVLIQSPLVSLYRGLFMNGAHYAAGWHATPANYAALDIQSPGPNDPLLAPCYAENNTETANPDSGTAYWKERDLVARAKSSRIPVLWSHGFLDANTKPDNLTALYPLLRGPKRAWVGQFGHSYPIDANEPDVRELYVREAFDWLDAYVKGDRAALRRVQRQGGAVVQQHDSKWRRDDAWPPKDAARTTSELRTGEFVDVATSNGGTANEVGATLWSISQRLPYDVHLSGAPRVTLTARGVGPAQVVVKVFDIGPEGEALMVTRGAYALVAGKVSFDLYPEDWRFPAGHRIGVAVMGNDSNWFSASAGGGVVSVTDGAFVLPALRYDRKFQRVLYDEGLEPGQQFVLPDAVVKAGASNFRLPPRMRRR